METAKNILNGILSRTILSVLYGFTLLFCLVPRSRKLPDEKRTGVLLAFGTFHNPNWFLAHATPIAACGIKEFALIGDGHVTDLPNVRMIIPSQWASKLLSRPIAKFLCGIWYAIKYRPDMYMGYAIAPAAISALVLGRVFRRPACFQLTSGKLELEGGGHRAENRMLSMLGPPSGWIEWLAHRVTNRFDSIVVRGERAKKYLLDIGFRHRITIITGSVIVPVQAAGFEDREVDLIFVGRLTRRKRPDLFLDAVCRVVKHIPNLNAVIVGDGPEHRALLKQVSELGIEKNVEFLGLRNDVNDLVGRARLFVLTSRWEGLSIALLEAMVAGTVPVASDVGDLADVVFDGHNGFLLGVGDVPGYVERIKVLLDDPQKWLNFSRLARKIGTEKGGRDSVTEQWTAHLSEYVAINDSARSPTSHLSIDTDRQ